MEVSALAPARRQAVDHGCLDVGAVAAKLRVADVVEHNKQHAGGSGQRGRPGRPPGFRVAPAPADPAAELLSHVLRAPLLAVFRSRSAVTVPGQPRRVALKLKGVLIASSRSQWLI